MKKKTEPEEPERIGANIVRNPDGKYEWTYEVNLLKNPIFFFFVWKIFFFIFAGIFLLVNILDAVEWPGVYFSERLPANLRFCLFFLIGMTVVVALGYLIYAAVMGGKYCVGFEMDEKGIVHRQIALQAKKAKKIGAAAVLAGAATGRISTVGAGISAQKTEMYTEFSRVRKVILRPRRSLIKLNERIEHNQVYAAPEDFGFVSEFILSRCGGAKIKK